MAGLGKTLNRGAGRWYTLRANLEALAALALVAVAVWAVASASAGPEATRVIRATGKIVPIPSSIPHEEGDMIDRRIVADLRLIAQRYPIYVTDGYSGPLPDGTRAGCHGCHTRHSDHYNGLAVDIVPQGAGGRCDRSWLPITRLARWAEPTQNHPIPPFRWVGYSGDVGHGCGHHLHLSWNHAPAAEYRLASWVEALPGGPLKPGSTGPSGGPGPKPVKKGPTGGISQVQTGGLSPRD